MPRRVEQGRRAVFGLPQRRRGDGRSANRPSRVLAEVADGGGAFKVLNMPFRMSGAEVSPGPRVPDVGEHTEEVLREIGMSDAEVASAAAKYSRSRSRCKRYSRCSRPVTIPSSSQGSRTAVHRLRAVRRAGNGAHFGCSVSFCTRQFNNSATYSVFSDGHAISWIQPNCFSCLPDSPSTPSTLPSRLSL